MIYLRLSIAWWFKFSVHWGVVFTGSELELVFFSDPPGCFPHGPVVVIPSTSIP